MNCANNLNPKINNKFVKLFFFSAIILALFFISIMPSYALPPLYTIEDLEKLSKYTLHGNIINIKQITPNEKTIQAYNQSKFIDEISIKVEDESHNQHTDNIIRFTPSIYMSALFPRSNESSHTFQIGEDVSIFLTDKEPESINNYAGFIANKHHLISEGIAYDVISTKQPSPLKQLESGIHSRYVNCNEGLELLIKESTGHPICVKSETKIKLIERGWAKST